MSVKYSKMKYTCFVFVIVKTEVTQSCLTLCDPMVCSPPGSSVHGVFSRHEYWSGLPSPSPGDLPNPGIELQSPAWAGGFFIPGAPKELYPIFWKILNSLTSERKNDLTGWRRQTRLRWSSHWRVATTVIPLRCICDGHPTAMYPHPTEVYHHPNIHLNLLPCYVSIISQ